ncbi:hypothetical protein [Rhizobium leguminosarum]|uniref:hypothetical protein n=1 Tax=Rhizobium leguminosarum TaxID=384 RepID=UPI001A8E8E36|nr:hypothetical protein [Rhizobium leguminosarum]
MRSAVGSVGKPWNRETAEATIYRPQLRLRMPRLERIQTAVHQRDIAMCLASSAFSVFWQGRSPSIHYAISLAQNVHSTLHQDILSLTAWMSPVASAWIITHAITAYPATPTIIKGAAGVSIFEQALMGHVPAKAGRSVSPVMGMQDLRFHTETRFWRGRSSACNWKDQTTHRMTVSGKRS